MNIRVAQLDDIETLFEIRTSVVENRLSREEMAKLSITPKSIAEMLRTDCRAWIAEINHRSIALELLRSGQ